MFKKVMFTIGLLLGGGILAVMFYGLFYASNPKEIPSAQIGKQAQPFTVTTFDGQQLSLADFQGKPVVLNFWASWCVACRQEAHLLEAAHQRYTPQGMVFLGIAINDTREASLAFIRRYGKTYLLAPDDELGNVSLDYGVTAVPETFLIDKNGMITEKVLGAIDQDTLQRFIDAQL
ncbi:MAG: TlpA family protein disulfide reductase [Proteobacteria bacterium]|nr:TlpA family protein disulfide reductase [Pseudomonadota bacterium]